MRTSIPILFNHDPAEVIGAVDVTTRGLRVQFSAGKGLTHARLFEVFGNVGIQVHAMEGDLVTDAEILEWSLGSNSRGSPGADGATLPPVTFMQNGVVLPAGTCGPDGATGPDGTQPPKK